ncbi:NAD(P)/FAD-dependent oxidoreductase [Halorientalis salina]|uniref:NAD(P)/FAD-dependent oxidoreductase n=1 Tax=Halorientalis salina TaxID=2932266 RepID=UPI0010ACAB5D|nr:FAD-dependent oxidoreductase [Halorientalis salina]
MTDEVAIVGAGAAGAGAAYALRDANVDVTVFEKSRGVCGRAATRRKNGCTYDYGANYVKAGDDRVSDLITGTIDDDGLVDIEEPIWTFDVEGTISEGRDADEHKWTYEAGITQLGKRLFAETDATVENGVRVEEPVRADGGWQLRDDQNSNLGTFDALLLTPPAPQTSDLFGAANWEHRLCRELRRKTAGIPYRTIVSAVLHYPFEVEWPYYALVNTDKDHDVGWVSNEGCKDGHVSDGEGLLVAQMSPDWSVENYDIPDTELTDAASDLVADLVDNVDLAKPDWTDTQHWRYAQPDGTFDDDLRERATEHDLFFAGDWVAGEARVHAALRCGLETGERIAGRA